MLHTVLFRVRASLNDLSITENQEQIGKKKEAEFLSKKINEYAANIRHFEVFKKARHFLKIDIYFLVHYRNGSNPSISRQKFATEILKRNMRIGN